MSKPYRRAVTFGRFNLLHRGHMNLFEEMFKYADTITIGISTGKKNLPEADRDTILRKALKDTDIISTVTAAEHPWELFDHVKGLGHPGILLVFGDDQYALAHNAAKAFGWDSITVERLTSSTAVRGHIDREELDILSRLVPVSVISDLIKLRKKELALATIHTD